MRNELLMLDLEAARRDLAAARERIGVLEGALGDLRDELEMDVDADVTSDNRELLEIVETALAAPEAEGKAESAAEHFHRCGPFCKHVEHCPDCVDIHGNCGQHKNPGDDIRWRSRPPEPQPEGRGKKMDWDKFQRIGKELFGDMPEEEITRLLDHNKPEDIMRRAGWLSPAEAEKLKDDLGEDLGRALRYAYDQRARAEKAEALLHRRCCCDFERSTTGEQVLGECEYHRPIRERAERAERERDAFAAERDAARKELEQLKEFHAASSLDDDLAAMTQLRDAAQAQAAATAAAAAQMREALELWRGVYDGSGAIVRATDAALQSDAGRGYVRAERLRGEVREALLFSVTLLESHRYNWEHDGDEESGQHDEDCRACDYEALLERNKAALAQLDTLLAESEGAG